MTPDDLLRFERRVPRYTSYPTAADFTAAVDAACYREWLGAVPPDEELSLYVHIPFCSSLCWFCGCHTTVVRHHQPIAAYLGLLRREIEIVALALGGRRRVVHLHWGGGTPTILRPADIHRLADRLHTRFRLTAGTEFAVEVDPRGVRRKVIAALAEVGVTRVSIGVQDFDPEVQRAVNRIQPFDVTERVVDWLRAAGIDALNIDLLYGLPGQTTAGLVETVDKTIALKPSRIAVYGYAHVPWMKRHQRLIDGAGPVFADLGFAAASMAGIGERVGVTKGGVYFHFRTTEDLFFAVVEHLADDQLGLFVFVLTGDQRRSGPVGALREERLRVAFVALGDDAVGGFEDRRRTAIVLFQPNHPDGGEIRLKFKNVANVRTPPAVDRLVGIAGHGQIRMVDG